MSLDFRNNNIPGLIVLLVAINTILLLFNSQSILSALILIVSSIFLVSETATLIPLIFVTSINSSITVIPGVGGIFYYSFLLLLSCIFKGELKISNVKVLILIIIYSLWLIISSVFSITGEVFGVLRVMVAVVPLIIVSCYSVNHSELNKYMFVMAVTASIYICLKMYLQPVLYVIENYSVQITISEDVNPNTLAQSLIIFYLIIFVSALELKHYWYFIFCIFSVIPIIVIGSRTVFISLVIISLLIFVLSTSITRLKKFMIVSVLLVVGSFAMNLVISANARLDAGTIIQDKGSGRFHTWEHMMNKTIPENYLTGIGYGKDNLTKLGYEVDADNLYVDILCQLGIPGFILFFILIACIYIYLLQINKLSAKIAQSFIMFIILVGIGETIFDSFIFWFIIFYSLVSFQFLPSHKIKIVL